MFNFLFLETPLVRNISVNKSSPGGVGGDENAVADGDEAVGSIVLLACLLGDTRVGTSRGGDAVVEMDRSVSLSDC